MSKFEKYGNYERINNVERPEQRTDYMTESERQWAGLGLDDPRLYIDDVIWDKDTITAIQIWTERKLREREQEREILRRQEIEDKIAKGEFVEATDSEMTVAEEKDIEKSAEHFEIEEKDITPRVQEILTQMEERQRERERQGEIERENIEKLLKEMKEKIEKHQNEEEQTEPIDVLQNHETETLTELSTEKKDENVILNSNEPEILIIDEDEEVLNIPMTSSSDSNEPQHTLEEFAKKVEDGYLNLDDAIDYLKLEDIKDIVNYRGNDDMDLLQIAVKNNYTNLFNKLISGIDIEKKSSHLVPGHSYRRQNGSTISSPLRHRNVINKDHIELFQNFDLTRKDKLGNTVFDYCINAKNDVKSELLSSPNAEIRDKAWDIVYSKENLLYEMIINSSPSNLNVESGILNYLISKYYDASFNENGKKVLEAISKLLKYKPFFEKLWVLDEKENLATIIYNALYIGTMNNSPITPLFDEILKSCSLEERNDIWQYIIETFFKNQEKFSELKIDEKYKLFNLMEIMMKYDINITKEDLNLINDANVEKNKISITTGTQEDLEKLYLETIQKRETLFTCNVNKLETLSGKSPNVLRAILGDNYLEELKIKIDKDPNNIDALRNAITSKWNTENNLRLFMFNNLGEIIGVPNEDGHTLFSILSSSEIVEVFEKFNPILSNEAIMDITDKTIFKDTNGKSNPIAIQKLYNAIYNYIPNENVEEFYNFMIEKLQNNNDTLFDFQGGIRYDVDGMWNPEFEMAIKDILNHFSNKQNSEYYGNKLQQLKVEVRSQNEQHENKEFKEESQIMPVENELDSNIEKSATYSFKDRRSMIIENGENEIIKLNLKIEELETQVNEINHQMQILEYKINQNKNQQLNKQYIDKLKNDYNKFKNKKERILNDMKLLQNQAHELDNLLKKLKNKTNVISNEEINRK